MIDEQTIQALKDKHGDKLSTVEFEEATIVLRRPSRAEFQRFRALVTDEKKRLGAAEKLVRDIVVYPATWEQVDALFDDYPALEDQVSAEAVRMAGGSKDVIVGKL